MAKDLVFTKLFDGTSVRADIISYSASYYFSAQPYSASDEWVLRQTASDGLVELLALPPNPEDPLPQSTSFRPSCIAAVDDDIIYVGDQTYGIARTLDGGSSWEWHNDGLVLDPYGGTNVVKLDNYSNLICALTGPTSPVMYYLDLDTDTWIATLTDIQDMCIDKAYVRGVYAVSVLSPYTVYLSIDQARTFSDVTGNMLDAFPLYGSGPVHIVSPNAYRAALISTGYYEQIAVASFGDTWSPLVWEGLSSLAGTWQSGAIMGFPGVDSGGADTSVFVGVSSTSGLAGSFDGGASWQLFDTITSPPESMVTTYGYSDKFMLGSQGSGEVYLAEIVGGEEITVPTITESLSEDGASVVLTVSPSYDSYQWYLDGAIVEGETAITISVTVSGTYRVDVTNELGDSTASTEVDIASSPSFSGETVCTDDQVLETIPPNNALPTCQGSMQFTTAARASMPAGKYSIEYDAGIDIHMHNVGERLYMGCDSKTLVYDAPPHLGLGGNPNDNNFVNPIYENIGSMVYDAGYVYGSHFPANSLLLEVRLTDRQMANTPKDDRRGISPRRTCNKQSTFADSDRHSLMVMHYENCIDNSASFYPLYDKLFLVEGQFNEAASFTLSPLIVDNLQYVSINEGTIMMWVKRFCTARGTRYYLVDMEPFQSTDLINPAFSLYIDERNRLTFEIVGYALIPGTSHVRRDVFAVRYPIKTTDLDDTSKFNHLAITWKNDNADPSQNFMRLYINGNKQSILKYDTGAKFGISELTEEEMVMGDYVGHSVVGADECFSGSGPYCATIGSPSAIPPTLPAEVVAAFGNVSSDMLLYDSTKTGTSAWVSNMFGETSVGEKDGKWIILQNNPLDPSKDQVRQIVANTSQYLLLDRAWDSDNLPIVSADTTYTICGKAYFITARLDKMMQTKLPELGLSSNIDGLKQYWIKYVNGKWNNPNYRLMSDCTPDDDTAFSEWIYMLNYDPYYKYDAVPTDFLDIKSTGKELRHLSVVNSLNMYDFPHIFIGSDRYSGHMGNVAIDQLAFYSRVLEDDELSVYFAPSPINTSGQDVTLGYDFNASSTPTQNFTILQDEKGRAFETYINVLNPFNLPIDRTLLTGLLDMTRPVGSTFFVNYA